MEHNQQHAVARAAPTAAAADPLEGSNGLQDPTVQAALLRHPAASKDQQVGLALLQASKQLQWAIAEQCAGQVPAVLHVWHLQQALCFAQHWLPKHGGLLRELEVQLGDCSDSCTWECNVRWTAAAVEALAALEQQQHLLAFCLRGAPAGPILQHLPATRLTRLCVNVEFRSNSNSLAALARLTGLRSLDLCDSSAASVDNQNALAPIAGLQQLTELGVGRVAPLQLQRLQLPPLLQQLDVTVHLHWTPTGCAESAEFAGWLERHGSIVRRLALYAFVQGYSTSQWAAGTRIAAALQSVGSAPPAVLPAAAAQEAPATATAPRAMQQGAASSAPAAAVASSLQLQSFAMNTMCDVTPILRCLPASRLTHLECGLNYSRAQQWSALCALTALRSLSLDKGLALCLPQQPSDVLAPLSALKQLTLLSLSQARAEQLQGVPAWLQALEVWGLKGGGEPFQLGHLTAMSAMHCFDWNSPVAVGPVDVLPPNLRVLWWPGCVSVQPLLALSRLESLTVTDNIDAVPATELQQLSSLPNLADVQLRYRRANEQGTETTAAWRALPLRSLELDITRTILKNDVGVSAAVSQQLGVMQGLTRLVLHGHTGPYGAVGRVRTRSVAAVLKSLTALHVLEVLGFRSMLGDADGDSDGGGVEGLQHSAAGVAACVEAVCGLPALTSVNLKLPVRLDSSAQQQLASMTVTELLPLHRFCVDDDRLLMVME